MEIHVGLAEEEYQKSNECNVMTKCLCVDLVNAAEEQEATKCGHFSIRGYVAEMRKSDKKTCWPFSLDGNGQEAEKEMDLLPPLHVPQFRWWGCQNCLSTGAADIAVKPASKGKKGCCDKRKLAADTSMRAHHDKIYPENCINEKEKAFDTTAANAQDDICQSGDSDDGSRVEFIRAINRPTNCTKKHLPGDRVAEDAEKSCFSIERGRIGNNVSDSASADLSRKVINASAGGRSIGGKPSCEILETAEDGVDVTKMSCDTNICMGLQKPEKLNQTLSVYGSTKASKPQRAVNAVIPMKKPVSIRNEVMKSAASDMSKLNSFGINESDRIYDGAHQYDDCQIILHDVLSGTLNHKKVQKLRSLSDIVEREKVSEPRRRCRPKEMAPENGKSKISRGKPKLTSGLSLNAIHKNPVYGEENFKNNAPVKKKKRKMLQGEHSEPHQMRWLSLQEGEKDSHFGYLVSDAELVEKVSGGMSYSSSSKNFPIKNKLDVMQMCQKRKKKKRRVEDGWLPPEPQKKGLSRELLQIGSDLQKTRTREEIVGLKSAENAIARTEVNIECGKHDQMPLFWTKQKKKKQVNDGLDSLLPLPEIMPRNDLIMRSADSSDQVGAASFSISPAWEIFPERSTTLDKEGNYRKTAIGWMPPAMPWGGVDFSCMGQGANVCSTHTATVIPSMKQSEIVGRSCFSETYKNSTNPTLTNGVKVFQVDAGKGSGVTWKFIVPKKDQFVGRNANFEHTEATIGPKYSMTTSSGAVLQSNLNNRESIYKEDDDKKNLIYQFGCSASPVPPGDTECACSYGKQVNFKDIPEVSRNQFDRRTKDVYQPEALDDIPMEIVELLAKNRQQRRQAEDAYQNSVLSSDATRNVGNTLTLEPPFGNGKPRLLQEKISYVPKPQLNYAGVGPSTRGSIVESSSNHSISHPYLSRPNWGSSAFSRANPFDSVSVGRKGRWTEESLPHAHSSIHLQPFGAHNPDPIFLTGTQHSELPQYSMPNVESHFSRTENCREHARNHHNQNAECTYETLRTNPEFSFACSQKGYGSDQTPVNSLSLQNNECIPAMDLLRLMDAGMRSKTSVTGNEIEPLLKNPYIQNGNCRKKLSSCSIYIAKNQPSGQSYDQFLHDAHTSLLQSDGNIKGPTGVSGQVLQKKAAHSAKSKSKQEAKRSCSSQQRRTHTIHVESSNYDPNKDSSSSLTSLFLPVQSHQFGDLMTNNRTDKNLWMLHAAESYCRTEICSVNRNPADFTIPEAGNLFMRHGLIPVSEKKIWNQDRTGSTRNGS